MRCDKWHKWGRCSKFQSCDQSYRSPRELHLFYNESTKPASTAISARSLAPGRPPGSLFRIADWFCDHRRQCDPWAHTGALRAAPQAGFAVRHPRFDLAATAHAATFAGLIPYFIDVDPDTWALDPNAIVDEISRAPGFVSSVVPVVPFGCPIDVASWDDVRTRTGLAVVIDAAAAFDSLIPGVVPSVVSLHATKVLGIGEGGCIVSVDTGLIKDLRARANFGFFGSREALVPAINAKLSEYHAAIGLAALEEWAAVRAEWMQVARAYGDAFAGSNRIGLQRGFGNTWVTSTCVLDIADAGAERVERALAAAQIETRRWWGQGAHAHPATAQLPRAPVSVTEGLARSTIGVPFYRDLDLATIQWIADCVHAVA